MEMSPVEFIEIAEKAGLIHELGDQIIELAMRQAKAWREAKLLDGKMSINLSPHQLCSPVFVDRFVDLLNKTEATPEWFELEITENAMVSNMEVALKHMEELREIGVTFAIDDFGTGYSSLNYLRTFPVSTLKIDLSFVQDIPGCSRAVAVAKSILVLGHDLGMTVVAEGVETTEQCEFLEKQGCDIIQGFLFSRALEPEGFEAWVISNKQAHSSDPVSQPATTDTEDYPVENQLTKIDQANQAVSTDTIRLEEFQADRPLTE
jgi:EAL domain-containing protein (putative c-di-GMP-specific phosphodiesterase class I)